MMNEKELALALFKLNHIDVPPGRMPVFEKFVREKENLGALHSIKQNGDELMAKWKY